MRRLSFSLAAGLFVCLFSASASAAANYVYHEQTANFVASPTCPSGGADASCGRYVENTDRDAAAGYQLYSPETYTLHFKVEYRLFTDQARVFYTTDGSAPSVNENCAGIGPVCDPSPTGTTQEAVAAYTCTYSDQNHGCQIVDVLTGAIPPQPAGTTVKYILAAWHSEGGPVVYANSGTCALCTSCTDSSTGCATVFQYNVLALPAAPLVISEFRLRGPGADAVVPSPDDAFDEFVEIYNNSDNDITVNSYDGSAGFALVAADGITRFVIPNGTPIRARGHYLGVNSAGYSLGSYPASTSATSSPKPAKPEETDAVPVPGKGKKARPKRNPIAMKREHAAPKSGPPSAATAAGDAFYTEDIADNVGIALFNTANPAGFTLDRRLDAAGSTSEMNTIYKEGDGYPAILPLNINYSWYRDACGKGGSITTFGTCSITTPKDTEDNAADFIFTEPNGLSAGNGGRLGAPGPENSTSPIQRNSSFIGTLFAPCVSSSAPPNRERDPETDSANNSSFGTLTIRRRIINNSGVNVTRLRFRIVDITTFPAPAGVADLRARSSSALLVASHPCTGLPATVQGTMLEEPPNQPNGGGFNSSLSADIITMLSPLPPADNPATTGVVENAIDVQFLLGVQQPGRFKFYVNIEALP